MLDFCLVGKHITHSRSHLIYRDLIEEKISYEYLDLNEDELDFFSIAGRYQGVSVTAPYKEQAFNACHVIMPKEMSQIKAVNCLVMKEGKLWGTNTDYLACELILERFAPFSQIIILGDGAMGRVFVTLAQRKKISYEILSRKNKKLSNLCEFDHPENLIVNCCARQFDLGLFPLTQAQVWDLNYDQKYNKDVQQRLRERFVDGSSLLLQQAKIAVDFWRTHSE